VSALRWLLGTLGGLLAWLLARTFRLTTTGDEHRRAARPGGLLYAMWHEDQLAIIMTVDDFPLTTIASKSKDGDFIAAAMRIFRVWPARGSSSRGGKEALHVLLGHVQKGASCGFTVDGPRGPRHVAKVGICRLAELSGRPVIPMVAFAVDAWVMRSWDRFRVPKPFTRIERRFGPPIWIRPGDDLEAKAVEVSQAIAALDPTRAER
jgi:lysophospholipid acyltransferase (LPLAT)-like uncharacterized protein